MFAVIDTNVLVSAKLTKNPESPTCKIYDCIDNGDLIPLYNDEILAEYRIVLNREKFHISSEDVETLIELIQTHGISAERFAYECLMPDEKDRVFYEISLSIDGSFLVTGNLKHFPTTPQVVSPAQMIEILEGRL